MTLDAFKASLAQSTPPAGLTPPLMVLWYDGKGDWEGAHRVAQDIESPAGSWIHAYLHRKEGDAANAAYWYRRAGQPVARIALDLEWAAIVDAMLQEEA